MSAPQSLSLERLLWSWPSVIKAAPAGWERGFALSIAKASKHPGWAPSAKQYERMCQMVADLYAGGDGEVIHHSGKDSAKGARGSGSLRAACDTEIELTRTEGIVTAEAKKQRDLPCGATFSYVLKSVFIGHDEDGDRVSSAVIMGSEAAPKRPKLNGSDKIAMQALSDALAEGGKVMHSPLFPRNRECVTLEAWRAMCDRHSLSSGESAGAARKAFFTVKNRLLEKGVVRIVDKMVWRCSPDDEALPPLPSVTCDAGNAGQSGVTAVTAPYKRAELLHAAQKAGKTITPELTAEVDKMAQAYATAGLKAEEAADKLQKIKDASERGRDALEDMFGGIIDGSMSAREAVANLLGEIAKAQLMSGAMGLLGQTSWGGSFLKGLGGLVTPSYDGGGYTGNGSRSGGLDGKGGFLAMMHPRETVTDHTKGQGGDQSGGGATSVHVTVGIDESGNLQVRKIAQQEAASMGQAVSASIPGRIQQYSANPRRR